MNHQRRNHLTNLCDVQSKDVHNRSTWVDESAENFSQSFFFAVKHHEIAVQQYIDDVSSPQQSLHPFYPSHLLLHRLPCWYFATVQETIFFVQTIIEDCSRIRIYCQWNESLMSHWNVSWWWFILLLSGGSLPLKQSLFVLLHKMLTSDLLRA